MKSLNSLFDYNRRQRNGIFFLLFIIIGLQFVSFYADFTSKKPLDFSVNDHLAFQKELDSLKEIQVENNKFKLNPFNPNFITDYKGYQLGMSPLEIDRLHAFRKDNKYINSAMEFQRVTGIPDSALFAMSPYFKFPEWVSKKDKNETRKLKKSGEKPLTKRDINHINFSELKSFEGVSDKLANRILRYKEKLQGFSTDDQLYEVWYLNKDVADRILQRFEVKTLPDIQKLNINVATFKQVLSIVYIDFELTKKIFSYRDEVAEIQSIEELKKIDGFPLDKFNRIALYLVAE